MRLSSLALLTAAIFLASSTALAQRGLDRGLTTSRPAPPEREAEGEIPDVDFIDVPSAAPTEKKARLLLQPLGSVSGSDTDLGFLAGYLSEDRWGPWRWQLTGRGVRRYRDGTAHAHWQFDGEIRPPLWKYLKVPLAAAIYYTHTNTIDVVTSNQLAVEIDLFHEPRKGAEEVDLGAVTYHGWKSPQDGASTKGLVFGFVGYVKRGRFDAVAEYDLPSDFAGENYYTVLASFLLSRDSSPEWRVRGGWEKGNTYSLRLEVGVPHNKVTGITRSR